MNKIFKVVYDKAKGNYVVTSEYGKTHKKNKRSTTMKTMAMAMILPTMITAAALPWNINIVRAADAVTYDTEVENEHEKITLDGPNGIGTVVDNLANGEVSAGSRQAVNGSQLYELSQDIGKNTSTMISLQNSISGLSNKTDQNIAKLATLDSKIIKLEDQNDTGYTIKVNESKGATLNSKNKTMNFVNSETIKVTSEGNNTISFKGVTGAVAAGAETLVTGNDVYQAIKNIPTEVTLDNKLDADLGNLNAAGEKNFKKKVSSAFSVNNGTNTTVSKTTEDDGTTTYTVNVTANGEIEKDNTGLISGGKVFTYLKNNMPTVDTSNLTDINLSNITSKGKEVIKNTVSTDLENKADKDATNVDIEKWTKKLGTTYIKENGTGFISSGTLFEALKDLENDVTDTLDEVTENFATFNADNIGKNLKTNNGEGYVTANELEIQRNLNSWGRALGTGSITDTSEQLVTGKTVYNALTGYATKNASNADIAAWQAALGTGTNAAGDTGLITGDTLNKVLKNYSTNTGTTTTANESITYTGSETIEISDNNKISVKTNGQVEKGNAGIVTGGQVQEAINKATKGMATESNIANKANKDLDNITDKGREAIKETMKESLNTKADKSYVDEELNKKADLAYVNTQLNTKADKTYVDNELKNKVSKTELTESLNTAMADKATKKELTEGLALKADKTYVDSLNKDKVTKEEMTEKLALKADKTELETKANNDASNLSSENVTAWSNALGVGEVKRGNQGLVNGNAVYEAIMKVDANKGLVDSSNDEITIGAYDESTSVNFTNSNGENRVLTGVKTDSKDETSVANVGYVQETENNIYNNVNTALNNMYGKINEDINKGVAGAAALAALHPLEYDPEDKVNFAVGYGHYKNANAAAIGAFYYANENTMFSVGASIGNGNNAVNAGISFKFGKGSSYNGVSKAEMAAVLNKQTSEIEQLKKDNAEMKAKMEEILKKMK